MTKDKLKDTIIATFLWTLFIVISLLAVIYIGLTIYVIVKYGNQPITEIPSWALWLMFWR